jgi:hypothetical protein
LRPNWAAVSALAGAVAAVVALVAYLAPSAPPPPPQSDAVVTTRPPPPAPSPSPESSAPQRPVPSPTRAVPSDSPLVSPVRPGGCDEAETALTAYRRNAGTTRSSQAAAAQQTSLDLMGAGLDAQGAVGATIRRLAAEFRELNFRLTGMTGGDPNQVIADINTDLAEFKRLCGSG